VVRHALVQRIVRAYESAKPQQQELPLSMTEGISIQPQTPPAQPAKPQ
jgi:phosphate starvation-inducible PhoH-like protein